jgi:hypothetical protein
MGFWLAIVGGLLLLASEVFHSPTTGIVGALLFLGGLAWLLVSATLAARRTRVSFGRAVAQSAKATLRFALDLLP